MFKPLIMITIKPFQNLPSKAQKTNRRGLKDGILKRNKSAVLTFTFFTVFTFRKTESDSKLWRIREKSTTLNFLRSFHLTQPHDGNLPKF